MIYLDHAATTPLPEAVADTMYDVLRHQFGNPSAQYPLGREAKELVEELSHADITVRAREIAEVAEENGDILIEKPVQIAIEQLARSEYKIIDKENLGKELE